MELIYILLLGVAIVADGANIIFLNMFASKSHALTMLPLAERLAQNGHNVTMFTITIEPLKLKSGNVNVLEAFIKPDENTLDAEGISKVFWFSEFSPWGTTYVYEVAYDYLRKSIGDPVLNQVLKTSYDIAIVDETYTSLQGTIALKLRKDFGTKVIAFATTELMPVSASLRAYHRNPITMAKTFLQCHETYSKTDTFSSRLDLIIDYLIDRVTSGILASQFNLKSGLLLDLHDASKAKFFRQAVLTVNDFPDQFSDASPRGHDLHPIGAHCPEARESLSQEFRDFIKDPTSLGTIYVAFGSYVDLDSGPPGVVDKFINALNQLEKYRVIWSYKGATNRTKKHIKIVAWAPQQEILAHPKTLVFFTHGGLKSVKEGVCANVAMLFLPFFGDQARNANSFVLRGIAESVHKLEFTVEGIVKKLRKLLKNHKYRENAQKMNREYLDSPMHSLDFGRFQVEKVGRLTEKHFFKFRRMAIDLSYVTFLSIDFVLLILSLILIVIV